MDEKIVITFGTFDLLHIGHINILERAAKLGTTLIVGISTDAFNLRKKNKLPVYSEDERLKIISSLRFVDHVFFEESLEKKREYILKYGANVLTMGDDWEGRFDEFKDICSVVYFPRTENISTTEIIQHIKAPIDRT
jgi:choline-phosphate cytidylyltransferase